MAMNYQKMLDLLLDEIGQDSKKPSLLLHACCGPCSSYVLEYLVQYFDITVFYYNPNIYPEEEYRRRFDELKKLYTSFPPALEGKVQVVEKAYIPEEFYNAVGTREEPALAVEPEKGERCRRCYEFRLKATYEYACQHNFDYFCTTLSISPFKDADKLNVIGQQLENDPSTSPSALLRRTSGTTDTDNGDTDNRDRDNCPAKRSPDNGNRDKSLDNGDRNNCLTKRSLSLSKGPQWLISDFKKKNGFKRSLEISEEYGMYRQEYCGCVYSKNSRNL